MRNTPEKKGDPQHPEQWRCSIHGVIPGDNTIVSTIPGHKGSWCMLCMLAHLDKVGISRVEPWREYGNHDHS